MSCTPAETMLCGKSLSDGINIKEDQYGVTSLKKKKNCCLFRSLVTSSEQNFVLKELRTEETSAVKVVGSLCILCCVCKNSSQVGFMECY